MLRIGVSTPYSPSVPESSTSENNGTVKKYSLSDDLGVHEKAIKATKVSDYVGSKSENQIPSILAEATYKGDVVSVANSMAVLAAMGKGHGKILVTDTSKAHLAGVQSVLRLAETSENHDAWISNIKDIHKQPYAAHIEGLVSKNNDVLSFDKLQERVRSGEVIFFTVDLSHPSATSVGSDASNGVSAIYASNIEMYLAGLMANDNKGHNERQQSLDSFKTNLTGMMKPDAVLIHGSMTVRMQVHDRHEAVNNCSPEANA